MTGPLADVRIVELAGIGPGPHAGMVLSDMGADVVRVVRPAASDVEFSGTFTRRGRTSVRADLKDEADRARVLELLDAADVLIEGLRPGATERLGLGPGVVLARNPRLVYTRITGWGQTGPLASTAGHDINYISLTGALHAVGPAAGPVPPLNFVGDYGGGSMFLVTGILAALLERGRSGQGQVLDVAMVDGAAALVQPILELRAQGRWTDERASNLLDGAAPFYRTYECSDGKHLAVGAIEPQFYAELLRILRLDAAALPGQNDHAGWPRLAEAIGAVIATKKRDEWAAMFDGSDACVTPVLSFAEAPTHPQIAARQTLLAGSSGVTAAPVPRFSRSSGSWSTAPSGSVVTLSDAVERWAKLSASPKAYRSVGEFRARPVVPGRESLRGAFGLLVRTWTAVITTAERLIYYDLGLACVACE
jgi:alpha-methylacyl-CoA racemase